jgi:integrase
MPLKLEQHDNGYWYVRGTVSVWKNGRPHSIPVNRSTKSRSEAEAGGILRQIEAEVAERNITGREPAISFRAAAARYAKLGGEERFLAKPLAHLGAVAIDQITQQILDDAALKAYPAAASATRRRQFYAPVIAVLRANGAVIQLRRAPDGQKRTIFMRPEEADKILKLILSGARYPNPWNTALATFLFGQGSRVGETLAIDGKRDISLPDRYAILRDTKNGKERMVTLCPRVIAALTTVPNLGQSGPLFLRYDGRPYAEREGRGYKMAFWGNALTLAGYDPKIYTPHTMRHSWATWFYSQTKDVVRLKAEGGWESSEWERYVKLAAPTIGKVAAKLGFDFREGAGHDGEAKSRHTG